MATALRPLLGLSILQLVAVLVRYALSADGSPSSALAGVSYALILGLGLVPLGRAWLAHAAAEPEPSPASSLQWRGHCSAGGAIAWGVLTAGILSAPVAWRAEHWGSLGWAGFAPWALVVAAVALSQELFFRGYLWQVLERAGGSPIAVAVLTAAFFAAVHVPFYGWAALPLDFAVGLLLGGLRLRTAGLIAPVVAHLVADYAGWWFQ